MDYQKGIFIFSLLWLYIFFVVTYHCLIQNKFALIYPMPSKLRIHSCYAPHEYSKGATAGRLYFPTLLSLFILKCFLILYVYWPGAPDWYFVVSNQCSHCPGVTVIYVPPTVGTIFSHTFYKLIVAFLFVLAWSFFQRFPGYVPPASFARKKLYNIV